MDGNIFQFLYDFAGVLISWSSQLWALMTYTIDLRPVLDINAQVWQLLGVAGIVGVVLIKIIKGIIGL